MTNKNNSPKTLSATAAEPLRIPVETHPFEPFAPVNAKLLMLGSFPPARKRWSMPFYYPNYINDMWRIFGIVFFDNMLHFVDEARKTFRLDMLVPFLEQKGIALFDTATAVRRLKNTASDKDLEVVEPTNLGALLDKMPQCRTIVTTGQKATDLLCDYFSINVQPRVGSSMPFVYNGKDMQLYRMPSSSRAYPMRLEAKAEIYRPMFEKLFMQDKP